MHPAPLRPYLYVAFGHVYPACSTKDADVATFLLAQIHPRFDRNGQPLYME